MISLLNAAPELRNESMKFGNIFIQDKLKNEIWGLVVVDYSPLECTKMVIASFFHMVYLK